MREFLTVIGEHYYVVLFAACDEKYLGQILSIIDPLGLLFKDKLTKQHCIKNKAGVGSAHAVVQQRPPSRLEPGP